MLDVYFDRVNPRVLVTGSFEHHETPGIKLQIEHKFRILWCWCFERATKYTGSAIVVYEMRLVYQ